eukprot:g1936.t1
MGKGKQGTKGADKGAPLNDVRTNHVLYEDCLDHKFGDYEYFSMQDCFTRMALSMAAFYYLAATQPVHFFVYTWRYNIMYYGLFFGLLLTMTYPVLPLALCVWETLDRIKQMFKADWKQAGPGAIFFARPPNPVAALFWDYWLNISMYTSIYLLVGTNQDGIDHGMYDKIANKHYWTKLIGSVGGRLPRTMFQWKDGELEVFHPLRGVRVMSKLTDSYLGIGDCILEEGKDFDGEEQLKEVLREKYGDKEALGNEFCVAAKKFGVHQLDVLTVRVKGEVKVARCIYWGECLGDTSHSATSAYMCDIDQEVIERPARWYSPTYKNFKSERTGQHLPGLKEVLQRRNYCKRFDRVQRARRVGKRYQGAALAAAVKTLQYPDQFTENEARKAQAVTKDAFPLQRKQS